MKDIGTGVGTVVVFLALALAVVALATWPTMIMFGVVHSYWAWLPAFGFWDTLGVIVLMQLLTSRVNQS